MTPHLARLFQDTKDAPYAVSVEAKRTLSDLFRDHGEALVEVLEQFVGTRHTPETYAAAYLKAQQLLAAMERSAGELFRNSEELEAS